MEYSPRSGPGQETPSHNKGLQGLGVETPHAAAFSLQLGYAAQLLLKKDCLSQFTYAQLRLCTLSSCLPRQYHLVNEPKTWTEAQRYCREKYTDLATIDNMEDMNRVYGASSGYTGKFWIGLYGDINTWSWSQGRSPFYREGETVFTNWADGQPNNNNGVTFVYIDQKMNWTEAQSYCRQHYTDLASVRSQTENQQIEDIKPANVKAWIGLYRDSWKWSDGSNSSFTSWGNNDPNDYRNGKFCTAAGMIPPRWEDRSCTDSFPFICYIVKINMNQQVSSCCDAGHLTTGPGEAEREGAD
ncbi:putative C-type lectin domain family 20 member A isoform X2 [Hypomesus transpacificus]|uniref:putative C-type lectin domain family 20 member A isoform X2 n=1 Tax=Hypomesus transpacificus TaxID=137520 RepID=UPI001F07BECD|nr:putative C-type lectin domain family 20 member A isoform X2 [Hypomesus transpacificus]